MKPKHLIILGIVLLIIAFIYMIIVANIPPPDATPHLFNDYNFHSSIAEWTARIALVALAAGIIWYIIIKTKV